MAKHGTNSTIYITDCLISCSLNPPAASPLHRLPLPPSRIAAPLPLPSLLPPSSSLAAALAAAARCCPHPRSVKTRSSTAATQSRRHPSRCPRLLPSAAAVLLSQLSLPIAPAAALIFFLFFPLPQLHLFFPLPQPRLCSSRALLNLFPSPLPPLPQLPLPCRRHLLLLLPSLLHQIASSTTCSHTASRSLLRRCRFCRCSHPQLQLPCPLPHPLPQPQPHTATAHRTTVAALCFLCQPRRCWLPTPAATQSPTAAVPPYCHLAAAATTLSFNLPLPSTLHI
ncbi:hypothetical protein B296_00007675 [Ensete ventricosum]|uniref:Uncharacterized protein n=1 Tax=Ensete ventricosum TaxID=4639 RepID=A0A427B2D6_ENSVE|nr:hypothetical protein B296_00007675 [Ensete ventricosum]